MNTDDLIASQIAYYRARAGQYDGELQEAARVEGWDEFAPRFAADVARLDRWLEADPPTGHVLEIAAGTGNHTVRLLRSADRVTALDAAPEMLAVLAAKHPDVERIEADVFTWEPPRRYDNVFFGYWISHVPEARWKGFWATVASALAPGGRVWFMDNAHPGHANTRGPGDWPAAAGLRDDDPIDTEIHVRRLGDGREWAMVKRYWWPDELVADLGGLGWHADVHHTDFAFIYGIAMPAPSRRGGWVGGKSASP